MLVHNHLREQLVQLRELVAEISDGRSDAAAVRGRINELSMQQNYRRLGNFCGSYCRVLHVHHTIEDQAMFPELVSARQSLGPVVRQLESEHQVIAELLTALDASLLSLVNGDGTLTDVREHVQALDRMLRSHLDYEEEELVEPLNLLNIDV
ncbi:hemerythrin domain-containing protein [Haloactinospora alba]|uniref:hemerythrin domain-containing protein n=1 Tax=Haloactinospora alba TaxID=405555 RepID=UPI001B8840F3|nr:hemerythrin domain-containing protein [Haloactinospora alba]